VGLFLSYYLDIASGASIVLLQALVFTVALWISSLQKTAARWPVQTDV
jgi:ABC-type Mn2+/Zn2+ transport system permease subunit